MERKLKRILVPLDGSARAEEAMPYAMTIAKSLRAAIILLAVAPLAEDWPDYTIIRSMLKAHNAALEAATVSEAVRFGDPMDEIVQLAEERSIDLIAMTTRGLTGKPLRDLGSVVSQVIVSAPVPVLAVKASDEPPAALESRPVRRLIVPVDNTGVSTAVRALTSQLAMALRTSVTVIHVRDGVPPDGGAIDGLRGSLSEIGVSSDYIEEDGEAARVISEYAGHDPDSMVIMSRRRPQAMHDDDVVGSVSDYIIRHTWTPVVVVPPEKAVFEVEEEPEYLP
jgi:nucleotide-binding universal stress UspA family protein